MNIAVATVCQCVGESASLWMAHDSLNNVSAPQGSPLRRTDSPQLFSIRIALGARPGSVVRPVLRQVLLLAAGGVGRSHYCRCGATDDA